MKASFLDTSGLIAVVNTDDQWHRRAIKTWEELLDSTNDLVTSSLILVEIADGLSKIKYRPLAVQIVEALRSSNRIRVIQIMEEMETHSWQLFKSRMDKDWGMTDCVSMHLMQSLGIDEVFSVDSDFAQAGFQLLIK